MAGHARFTAILDACVIYPHPVVDSLLSLAAIGLFAPKWTTRIEQEWIGALEEKRADLRGCRLIQRRDAMRAAVPDWEVAEAAWLTVAPSLRLPDPDDVHVLAAAIVAHADCIVTRNTRDFPAPSLAPFGLEVIDPDVFIINQLDLNPIHALTAFKTMRARNLRPLHHLVGARWITCDSSSSARSGCLDMTGQTSAEVKKPGRGPGFGFLLVERKGIEPSTSALRTRRSPS